MIHQYSSTHPKKHSLHVTVEKAGVVAVDKQEDMLCFLTTNTMAQLITSRFFIRQLSRHLVGLWTAENPVAMNLLKRILVSLRISRVGIFR